MATLSGGFEAGREPGAVVEQVAEGDPSVAVLQVSGPIRPRAGAESAKE